MRYFEGFSGAAKAFSRDTRGNFAVLFGITVPVLALAVGFAADVAQLMNAKSALQNAADAAATSTARSITLGDISEAEAPKLLKAFVAANGGGGILDSGNVVMDAPDIDPVARTVEVKVHAEVPLFFPLFGMDKTRRVSTSSTAAYSDKKIEVAMMLDLTGSMNEKDKSGVAKIKGLRDAADTAVRAFLDLNNASSPRVRVALVPYADGVNTGPLANVVFHEAEGSSGGKDAPPALTSARVVSGGGDSCATERKTSNGRAMDYSDAGPYTAMVNRDDRLVSCPASPLVPLTSDEGLLLNRVKNFYADGYTAGHIGVQWTRYMLSPSWRPALEAKVPGSGPAEYTDKKAKKIAILMTDGEFNTAFAGVPLSEKTRNEQGGVSRPAAEKLCALMKDDRIEIFTVGFVLKEAAAIQVMKNCATQDYSNVKHFYLAADAAELKAAFSNIAANVEQLALVK